jgi:hypothetical protein
MLKSLSAREVQPSGVVVKSGQPVENKKEVGSDWKKSDSGLEKES